MNLMSQLKQSPVQQDLQFAAVERILRPVIARIDASRFVPYLPTSLGEVHQLSRSDADLVQFLLHSELKQFPYRMRLHIDAHAKGHQFGSSFENQKRNIVMVA